ncbi:MAG: serine/threonine-protein kinase [Planctomycetota bacterium]|jgi:hypothetical protein|nr:serine/threonine-protein kinase [Planctomycetota bacterium]MDP6990455.1 serine/threonine-protein kinase [Planctomycetota bacterium]
MMSPERPDPAESGDSAIRAFQDYLSAARDGGDPDREACLASVGPLTRPRLEALLDDLDLVRAQRRLIGPDSGQRIGPYRLLEQLGRGGASIVWRGLDERLDREVAIKILHPFLAISSAPLARFEREARLGAGLDHPHIATVLDVGEADGVQYIVEELVAGGRTLAKWIAERAATVLAPDHDRRVAYIGEALCGALAAAHAAGIVHRDVKPSNVLMTPDDRPLLCDFGLAKLRDGVSRSSVTAGAGTPCYSSPEQLSGLPTLGEKSDLFSLGVTLYEALTLRRPFDGDTAQGVTAQVLHHEPPPPARLRSTLSPELSSVCMMAMEKNPARRYADATEMGADLARWLAGESVIARPPGPFVRAVRLARRFRVATTLLAAASLVVAVSLGFTLANAKLRSRVQQDNVHLRTMIAATRAAAEYMSPSRVRERDADQPPFLAALEHGARLTYADDPDELSVQLAGISAFHDDLGFAADAALLYSEAADLREGLSGPADPRAVALRLRQMDALELDFAHDPELAVGEALLSLDTVRTDTLLRAQVLSRLDRVYTWTEDVESLAELEERHGDIEEVLRKAIDALDPDGPRGRLRLRLRTDLGRHLSGQRRNVEATALLEANYDDHVARLGAEHLQTLVAGYWYGRALDRMIMEGRSADLPERSEVFGPLAATAERVLGPTSRFGLELRWKVGESYLAEARTCEALESYDYVYERLSRWLPPEHPRILSLRTARSLAMRGCGLAAESEGELREVVRIKTEVYGPDHTSTLIARRGLGQTLSVLGREEEALEEYAEGYRLFTVPPRSPSDMEAFWAAGNVIVTLCDLRRWEEAEHWARRNLEALAGFVGDERTRLSFLEGVCKQLCQIRLMRGELRDARDWFGKMAEANEARRGLESAPDRSASSWFHEAVLTFAEDARDGTRRAMPDRPPAAEGPGWRARESLLSCLHALRDREFEKSVERLEDLAADSELLGSRQPLVVYSLDALAQALRGLPPQHSAAAERFLEARSAAR